MQSGFLTKSLAIAGLLLALSPVSMQAGQANSPSPAQPDPEILAAHTITVNPKTAKRGSTVDVTVDNAPVGAKVTTVEVDGLTLSVEPLQTRNTYRVLIPDKPVVGTDGKGHLISLGTHPISVSFDGRWFTGDATLTVMSSGLTVPVLADVEPQQITNESGKNELTLTGSGFLRSPAEDNQILIDNAIVPVTWDGCPPKPASSDASAIAEGAHGVVDNGSRIRLCNLTLPDKLQVDVAVRQGTTVSEVRQIQVQRWSTTRVVLFSFGTVLIAIALVIFLASTLREYRVNKTTYGMFRILYLDSETNTYSLSKYQFYMWTAAAVFSYTYFALSRVFVQGLSLPDVPSSLPGIIGIGAGTAIGAQLVTSVRGPKGGGSELPSLGDFVTSGGVAAPERVQMFVWTNLGALAFCIAVLHDPPWHIADMPHIGDGLMYLMGISSAGYLGGKLARKPGPVLSEISISPSGPDGGVATAPGALPEGGTADTSQPIAAAQQALRDAQAAIAPVPATSSPTAFAAAQSALQALRTGIAAATAAGPDVLATLGDSATTADAGSQITAAEFARVLDASATDPQLENLRILAEQAQRCAAAAQDLASGVSQAVGTTQAAAAMQASAPPPTPALRVIELRGRNLSIDATFEINDEELPFRMLASSGGKKAPTMVAPEEDPNQTTLARQIRLSIDPSALGQADHASYMKWFASGATSLKVAITNPDGQRSEMSLSMPPGSQQSRA